MRFKDLKFLAEENISTGICAHLSAHEFDVIRAPEIGLGGSSDAMVLERANQDSRAVLTHDSDFGKLIISSSQPFFGVVYLRPGHIREDFTFKSLDFALLKNPTIALPFIIVLANLAGVIKMRIRSFN